MFTPTLVSPSKSVQYCFNDLAIKRWNMVLICTTFISDLIRCSILFYFIIGTINLCQNFIHHECKKTPPMGWNPFWRFFSFIKGIFNFSLSTLFHDRINILFICWNIDDDAVFFWKIDFLVLKCVEWRWYPIWEWVIWASRTTSPLLRPHT